MSEAKPREQERLHSVLIRCPECEEGVNFQVVYCGARFFIRCTSCDNQSPLRLTGHVLIAAALSYWRWKKEGEE